MTREAWLNDAVGLLAPAIEMAADATLPPVHVSIGFPSRGATSRARRRIGECWNASAVADGKPAILLSPVLSEPVEILGVLVHELIHAALPAAGHRAPFKRAADRIGLEGKPTATTIGPALRGQLEAIYARLGPLPHAAITPALQNKKQGTRLRLWECPCGVKVRVASDAFNATCGECAGRFSRSDGGHNGPETAPEAAGATNRRSPVPEHPRREENGPHGPGAKS